MSEIQSSPGHTPAGKMDCYGDSRIGSARRVNADQYLIADLRRSFTIHSSSLDHEERRQRLGNTRAQLLLVADGLAEENGQHASQLAVDTLCTSLLNDANAFECTGHAEDVSLRSDFFTALQECQFRLQSEAQRVSQHCELATTMTSVCVIWPDLFLTHVGDSRCYLFRNQRLQQLTTDHTYARKLGEHGVMDKAGARDTLWNNVLWNVVGGSSNRLEPEFAGHQLQIGDVLVLCTDGLASAVPQREIRRILARMSDAQTTCEQLLEAGSAASGSDNMTVVVARFHALDDVQRVGVTVTAADATSPPVEERSSNRVETETAPVTPPPVVEPRHNHL